MTVNNLREFNKLVDAPKPVHENLERNAVIAKAVCPKEKGWAWSRKTGLPIDFTDPTQMTALLGWVMTKPFWTEPCAATENMPPTYVWHEMTVLAAEKEAKGQILSAESSLALALRDLVWSVLKAMAVNNEQSSETKPA